MQIIRHEAAEQDIDIKDDFGNTIIQIGRFSYIAGMGFDFIDSRSKIKIGRFSSIGEDVILFLKTNHHPECIPDYPLEKLPLNPGAAKPEDSNLNISDNIVIGNDVLISHGVRILAGVTVSDGAVLAAGAVVTKDVRPYAIMEGNPAKEIRRRFDDETIDALLKYRWWDKTVDEIKKISHILTSNDVKSFKDLIFESATSRNQRQFEQNKAQNQKTQPSLSIQNMFAEAIQYHQSGHLVEAEQTYRRILTIDPHHADTLHMLGLMAYNLGKLDVASELISMAIAVNNKSALYYSSLAAVKSSQGLSDEVVTSYQNIIRLKPDDTVTCHNLGNLFYEKGRLDEAAACFRKVLALDPQCVPAYSNLGNTLLKLEHLDAAYENYRQALSLKPDFAEGYNNCGAILRAQGRWHDSIEYYKKAIALKPDYSEAYNNLGIVLRETGQAEEALICHKKAIEIQGNFAEAHMYLGMNHLLIGQYQEGWAEHEWRLRIKYFAPPAVTQIRPLWQGKPIGGQTLLLHAEYGFGDTLQFCRYVQMAVDRVIVSGGRVILEVPRPLLRLMSRIHGVAEVVAQGEPLPAFDLQCPLMSLPHVFGTTLETIPAKIPYLEADPEAIKGWRLRLRDFSGLHVGLVWAGNPCKTDPSSNAIDRRRSVTLNHFAPFANIQGINLISLQKGDEAIAQVASPPPGMVLHDWTAELIDFADTAALIEALDLVISVDTSVCHLAGALGKPVWMLNRFDTCWRWLLDRDDSPWYPSMRIFRQKQPGEWDAVIERVAEKLSAWAGDLSP